MGSKKLKINHLKNLKHMLRNRLRILLSKYFLFL